MFYINPVTRTALFECAAGIALRSRAFLMFAVYLLLSPFSGKWQILFTRAEETDQSIRPLQDQKQ